MELKTKFKSVWKPIAKTIILLALLAVLIYLHLSLNIIVFTIYLAMVILFNINSRISIWLGLIFLVICSIPLIIKEQIIAETYAKYAYAFLAIGVGTALVEYLKKPEKD